MKKEGQVQYLTPVQSFNLEMACRGLTKAFGPSTFQVGSSLYRQDYRDVDLRCILADEEYDQMIGDNEFKLNFLNTVFTEWFAARTGLPIDFQFQRMTEANEKFDGVRSFVGIPL